MEKIILKQSFLDSDSLNIETLNPRLIECQGIYKRELFNANPKNVIVTDINVNIDNCTDFVSNQIGVFSKK